ncbi:Protein-lysine N-methyltransferase EFM2 [Hypsizygus marmoreus]|uniref:Protein-lysine N-methyltransferase EFM2 n=1 Tax=Hypsizygus marmoreus TaxID=39966 RepID=A0A369K085_HYPMA|nr:Protein-lysine N-methyltransferase EFM2 [Hypsizygus marmoreus]
MPDSFQPPTSRLPPIQKIAGHPTQDLSDALAYLRHIYNPEVRGSRRRQCEAAPVAKDADVPMLQNTLQLDDLRSDTFERSYAIRWLTALVSKAESWTDDIHDTDHPFSSPQEGEALIQNAASLLAMCSGTAAAGVIVRDFVFSGQGAHSTVKLHVRDVPLDNSDYGSVGAQTWGGACVLAEAIVENPTRFYLHRNPALELRVLELGAGTGLVSLAVGKLIEYADPPAPKTTIIATDYFPSVLDNLKYNIQSNFSNPPGVAISSHFLDWSQFAETPYQDPPFDEPFDLVLGADIVYEAEHAVWIKSCLRALLRMPSGHVDPLFHLVIPLRHTHSSESNTVETVFSAGTSDHLDLIIIDKETIICDAGSGLGSDQIEYAYYKIGWR